MSKPSYGDSHPIAAPATALAESALALIRTNGSIELISKVFSRSEKLLSAPASSVVHGWIIDPDTGDKIDEVLVSIYRAPASYTGEDGADISCHGSIAVVKAVMEVLKKAGFRDALPGEFTFKAFMNGKLDLTRAESVMELVAAKTNKGRELALRRLSGVLEKEINTIKTLLVEVHAGTEIYLDYSEDEFTGSGNDEEAGRLPGRALAEEAVRRLITLAELWSRERIFAEGALAVLAGRPNAGKSSLFNYLIKEDRSIVTDVPGTTRDWIEALLSVEGIPLRLVDTAGLRDTDGQVVESIGIQRTFELLDKADLVIYVIDGTEGITESDREFRSYLAKASWCPTKPMITVWNKADIASLPSAEVNGLSCPLVTVSAKTGEGVPELIQLIAEYLEKPSADSESRPVLSQDAAGPGTLRQKELIDTALAAVEEALSLAEQEEALDIIAPLFRSAINALGEITGEIYTDDVLDIMFSRFCVGK